jgi:hypothetical protein
MKISELRKKNSINFFFVTCSLMNFIVTFFFKKEKEKEEGWLSHHLGQSGVAEPSFYELLKVKTKTIF